MLQNLQVDFGLWCSHLFPFSTLVLINFGPHAFNCGKVKHNFSFFFRDSRGSALESSFRKLGVEKLTKDDVQKMQWEALEAKIGNWIHFMRIAVRALLKLGTMGHTVCASSDFKNHANIL